VQVPAGMPRGYEPGDAGGVDGEGWRATQKDRLRAPSEERNCEDPGTEKAPVDHVPEVLEVANLLSRVILGL
jgi:hypothetical protein